MLSTWWLGRVGYGWIPAMIGMLALAGGLYGFAGQLRAEAATAQVEADWQQHDQQRIAQVRAAGLVRFAETQLPWPGVLPDSATCLPRVATPILDGRLDEPAWGQAFVVEPATPEEPRLQLCRDDQHVFVGLSLPSHSVSRYQGHLTALDAAGGVDGVKNGKYGFHTWLDANPWWQVDLGSAQPIERIVVYNRLDYAPGLHNADHLTILTSDDGQRWELRYDNQGRHFGGVTSGAPLEVKFAAGQVRARHVRLQLKHDAPIFFHLDEIEIYGADEPSRNLALHRPASQSSLSIWSRGGKSGNDLFTLAGRKATFGAEGELQLLLNGSPLPADRACIVRGDQATTAELALPIREMGVRGAIELVASGQRSWQLEVMRDWRVSIRTVDAWSAGSNTLQVELDGPPAFPSPVEVTVETVVFTLRKPERQVVFQQSFTQPAKLDVPFEVQAEGAGAVLVVGRQGEIVHRVGDVLFVEPVAETLTRAELLLAEFGRPVTPEWQDLQQRLDRLVEKERTRTAEPGERQALYREARWLARRVALSNPLLDFDQLLFAKRFTQQTYPDICLNHMPWCSRPGGGLYVVSPLRPDGTVRDVLGGQLGPGHVHGLDLWYDADRIVFGYAQSPTNDPPAKWLNRAASYELRRTVEPTHLFEIGLDGSGLRQLTEGEWSDLDPTYLPSGEVAFTSERCAYSLQCNELDKDETSCNLYITDPSGENVRQLTINKDGDYLPHTFDNGMIGYTRWEYHERLWAQIQSIWVVRPDGTGADAVFKQHFNDPWALEDARSIPGSRKLVATAAGHHTLATGPIVIVDATVGINNEAGIHIVTPGVLPPEGGMSGTAVPEGGVPGSGGYYQTPWPLSERHFLVSYTYGNSQDEKGYGLYLIDVYGTRELIYRDPDISCSHPIPVRPRVKPPVLAPLSDRTAEFATCVVTDVYEDVEGVEPGAIRYLRIASCLAWPYDNTHGGQRYEPDIKSVMINWNPARVIGIVPVEADGSAYFQVPANEAVYFQALDANFMEVRRMRSFINFEPGETRGCTGCHETRATAPVNIARDTPRAMLRGPSVPEPPSWGTQAVNFLSDVQPVLDAHCVRCHAGLKPAGNIDLSGGLTAKYNRAWETINEKQLIARSNIGDDARITLPYEFGSHKSRLITALKDANHAAEVRLAPDDWMRLVTWVDLNGPYHAGFINKRSGQPEYNLAADGALQAVLTTVHRRRCADCHSAEDVTRTDWIDVFRPDRSRFLTAPLGKTGGADRPCSQPVYAAPDDPDYQTVLDAVREAAARTWREPRRDIRESSAAVGPPTSEPRADSR